MWAGGPLGDRPDKGGSDHDQGDDPERDVEPRRLPVVRDCSRVRQGAFVPMGSVDQVGAGIVADSDPEREYDETLHKAAGIRLALKRWSGV